jgi:RNA methyltransferase, TrmH family
VRRLRKLADSARACREAGRTLAEGLHLIEAALAARVPIATLLIRGGTLNEAARSLVARVEAQGTPRVELAAALYDAIAPVEHGAGLMAEIAIPHVALPVSLIEDAVYLDAVQDPGNVGTLLRTAAAAGVRHVFCGPSSAYPWSPKVLRAGMGAQFALTVYDDVAPAQLARLYRGTVLAAELSGEDLYGAEWGRGPTLWMFGSEGQGLSAAAAALTQRRLRIPMAATVESLNVGAAAAVCLFEQSRRRRAYM